MMRRCPKCLAYYHYDTTHTCLTAPLVFGVPVVPPIVPPAPDPRDEEIARLRAEVEGLLLEREKLLLERQSTIAVLYDREAKRAAAEAEAERLRADLTEAQNHHATVLDELKAAEAERDALLAVETAAREVLAARLAAEPAGYDSVDLIIFDAIDALDRLALDELEKTTT